MTTVHVAAIMPTVGGAPEDTVQNNFYFHETGGIALTMATASLLNVEDFYTETNAPATFPIGSFISGEISRLAGIPHMRAWEVSEVSPYPETFLAQGNLLLPAAQTTASVVSEVAMVLAFHGTQDGSAQDKRRRGRIYLGPLNEAAQTQVATTPTRPSVSVINALREGARQLQLDSQALGFDWVVLSRASLAGSVSSVITGGWADNAFDTQRRRGPAATARNPFAIP